MDPYRRKIAFYSFKLKRFRVSGEIAPLSLQRALSYTQSLPTADRIWEAQDNDFILLDKVQEMSSGKIQCITFVRSKYNYRPPLVDRGTGNRRDNPKTLSEGDEQKTHMVLSYRDDEVIVLLEEYKAGIGITSIAQYLNRFIRAYQEENDETPRYRIENSFIPQDDFLKQMKSVDRITRLLITADRQILGSEQLNYCDRTEEVSEDITIEIHAKANKTLLQQVERLYSRWQDHSNPPSYRKIRVTGKDIDGNDVPFGAELENGVPALIERLGKHEYIYAHRNFATGEVNSQDCFLKMRELLDE